MSDYYLLTRAAYAKLSRPVARAALRTGLTPDSITINDPVFEKKSSEVAYLLKVLRSHGEPVVHDQVAPRMVPEKSSPARKQIQKQIVPLPEVQPSLAEAMPPPKENDYQASDAPAE